MASPLNIMSRFETSSYTIDMHYYERLECFVANSYKETMNLPRLTSPCAATCRKTSRSVFRNGKRRICIIACSRRTRTESPSFFMTAHLMPTDPFTSAIRSTRSSRTSSSKATRSAVTSLPYIPGWDCHGQPIEHMVEKTLGPDKMAATSQPELRKLCREWAERYVDVQREGFKRLGVNAEWDKPYLTFTPDFEAGNVEIFKEMYLKGLGVPRPQAHPLVQALPHRSQRRRSNTVMRSPRPSSSRLRWTSCPAFSRPQAPRARPTSSSGPPLPGPFPRTPPCPWLPMPITSWWRSTARTTSWRSTWWKRLQGSRNGRDTPLVADEAGEPVKLKGKQMCGLTYTCPIRQDLKGTIIYGDHVTLDSGTGAVHTAPVMVKTTTWSPSSSTSRCSCPSTTTACSPTMRAVSPASPLMTPILSSSIGCANRARWSPAGTSTIRIRIAGVAMSLSSSARPISGSSRWIKTPLREDALRAINSEVVWIPEWAKNRIGSMVADRPDWCISRQRSWGVPIPVFKCAKCGETVATEETFDAVIELFRTEGADAWFTRDPKEYLPRNTPCERCGCADVVPEKDILDVWWESGVSHTSVCKHRAAEGLHFPADMYLEGSDQHRGWFQSSLLTSVGAYGVPPVQVGHALRIHRRRAGQENVQVARQRGGSC